MDPNRKYTTQLQAGLGMVQETISLLRLYEAGDSGTTLAEKAIAQGLFSRSTARRARNIVQEMFGPRLLRGDPPPAMALKLLVEANMNLDDITQLCFLHTARAQAVFGNFVTEVFWLRYSAGASRLGRPEAEAFVRRALNNGRMAKRWTESTIRRVSGYLLGCCADFGLTRGNGRPDWTIARFAIRPMTALYLAYELHFSGVGDFALIQHPDWSLFGMEPHEVIGQLKNLANNGHLIVQATPELVQVTWKYKSLEECVFAIIKR